MPNFCSVEGCNKKHKGHGYCLAHLRRYKKYGDPLGGKMVRTGFASEHPREYNTWHLMIQRCKNKNATAYDRYGGRGIKICDRWLGMYGFRNFYEDMGSRPEGYTLDRIDNDGDYCPENCRWATSKTQNRNRSNNALITYNGETKTLKEWSEILGLSYGMLVMRHCKYGWTGDRLFQPARKYCKI